ncbi:helix-turn-helix transcriptional regulator [Neptunomonas antarctica]|uniref:DNA-binding transcriptional regulator, CsgD family n=1 Tax=Neptunomonas antarctica TaxID=619304 RepID=A0A1N7IW38_9GAMM|nr:LuxR family transcriptional regulator [Neptunomonas antarctica]SIS41295.1 DNA-binding transcriptional regulator, CsgD family [Neptunomonas antarctica]
MSSFSLSSMSGFEHWNTQLAELVKTLGEDTFFPCLINILRDTVKIDYPQVWIYRRNRAPKALYFEISHEERSAQIDSYIDGSYQLDPFYLAALINKESPGLYRITELSAKGFQQSEYYRSYYAKCDTEDEIVYIIEVSQDVCLQISLMRNKSSSKFSDEELKFLRSIETIIRELSLHQWEFLKIARPEEQDLKVIPGFEKSVNLAFDLFGRSMLTGREKDVLGLTLQGYSTQTSAEKLNISIETLRRHRKNIYAKLDINSQAELFSLFLSSLGSLEQEPNKDPLEIYMRKPQKTA